MKHHLENVWSKDLKIKLFGHLHKIHFWRKSNLGKRGGGSIILRDALGCFCLIAASALHFCTLKFCT